MTDFLVSGRERLARAPRFKLIGRDMEMGKLCSILVRRNQNSVILTSQSGAGASSLLLGLQALKDEPNPPFDIVSKSFFWLDSDALFSSGDGAAIDAAFRRALARMRASSQPVLVIEDSGDFHDACHTHGTQSFINLLNSAVNERRLQVIFEVSERDEEKVLRWHSGIGDAYTVMDLKEPQGDVLVEIVRHATIDLRAHHGDFPVDDDAIVAAVELTSKYRGAMPGAQPQRAIALLDRAMAAYRLESHKLPPAAAAIDALVAAGRATPEDLARRDEIMRVHADRQARLGRFHRESREAEDQVALFEAELEEIAQRAQEDPQVEEAQPPRYAGFASLAGGSLPFGSSRAAALREQIARFRRTIEESRASYAEIARAIDADLRLDRARVTLSFSRISGIPAAKLGENDKAILRSLQPELESVIFGQDEAIERVANAIKVARKGGRNRERPQASFMFMGPSGSGKTEIMRQLARILLGDSHLLTRLDMSEYMEKHGVAKMIGAPPGYEGFEKGGYLTNLVRANPVRIILFDEIEKAHPDVFDVCLQILDAGRLTDGLGRVVDFSQTIIGMTTNTGQVYFLDGSLTYEEACARGMEDLEQTYRSEFLNRFNGRENIIGFRKLELPSIKRIVHREVDDLKKVYGAQGARILFPEEQIDSFCAHRYNPVIGARGLPGIINAGLESQIVNKLLEHDEEAQGTFEVRYDTGKGRFSVDYTAELMAA